MHLLQQFADKVSRTIRTGISRRDGHAAQRFEGKITTSTGISTNKCVAVSTETLTIDCPETSAEQQARDVIEAQGRFLARQERWQDLSDAMGRADADRALTEAGMPHAELLSFGARTDVVQAVEHALAEGHARTSVPFLEGIEALESMLADHPRNAMLACVVAQSHMDIGWAWRKAGARRRNPSRNLEAFSAHFDRAIDILAPFDLKAQASAHLAAAHCALHAAGPLPGRRVERDFEWLIDLAPRNPAPMRAMGNYLSPRWHGNHEILELEARRTAARTEAVWGAGAYAWVMFDTVPQDPVACALLDVAFFTEGLQDILRLNPSQHQVNLLAAFCAMMGRAAPVASPDAARTRDRIADCAGWIVRDHLTEVHPLVWAHAAAGFDNSLRVPSPRRFAADGLRDALGIITGIFDPEIAAGRHIVFTPEGPIIDQASKPRH